MRSSYNRALLTIALAIGCGTAAATTPSPAAPAGSTSVYSDGAIGVIVAPQADGTANLLLVRNCKTDPTACVP